MFLFKRNFRPCKNNFYYCDENDENADRSFAWINLREDFLKININTKNEIFTYKFLVWKNSIWRLEKLHGHAHNQLSVFKKVRSQTIHVKVVLRFYAIILLIYCYLSYLLLLNLQINEFLSALILWVRINVSLIAPLFRTSNRKFYTSKYCRFQTLQVCFALKIDF